MNVNNFQNNESLKIQSNKQGIKVIIILILIIVFIGVIVWFFSEDKFAKKVDSNNNVNNQEPLNNYDGNSENKVDLNIDPDFDVDEPFLMFISDKFYDSTMGAVAVGQIYRGIIHVGDTVSIIGLDHEILTTTVLEIKEYLEPIDEAKAGDKVSIYLSDVQRSDIEIGQVLALPNSINDTKNFEAEITFLSSKDGGMSSSIDSDFHCQIHFNEIDVDGMLIYKKKINPGDNVNLKITLDKSMAIDKDMKFLIYDNYKTIGVGKIIDLE